MNAIKTLMLSMSLMIVSGVIYAEPATLLENNFKLNQMLTVDVPMNDEQDVEYFKHILSSGGLYALLLALNTEVPDVAKSVEYVALFKKLDSANNILTQILVELKKNNHLLSQSMLNKGVAMDG
jgi:DNA gyrase inhibitor GyrI